MSNSPRKIRMIPALLFGEFGRKQLALGVALGMLIGLLPKGNLIVVLLCFALYLFRTNYLLGILTAVGFTFLSGYLDPFANRIGAVVLNISVVRSFGSHLFSCPPFAWTMLDNTVVCGQCIIGGVLFFPLYFLMLRVLKNPPEKPTDDSESVSVLNTIPVEYNTPGFFAKEPTGGSGRFGT